MAYTSETMNIMFMLIAVANGAPTNPSLIESNGPHTNSQLRSALSGAANARAITGASISP